jgi:cobalt-zinc-cadmium resistance protein CzcA
VIGALAAGAVRHRRAVIMIWAVVLVVAAVRAFGLPLDALPDVTGNQVQVLTRAPGLTPEEVELRVTRPIEASLGGMPGLILHRSTSRYGLSAVTAVFEDDVDPYRARQLVAEKLGGVAGAMPAGVEAPELAPLSGGLGEVFHLVLRSETRAPADLAELANLEVAPLLRAVPGVVEVNTWGGERRRFEVRADPVRLADQRLSLAELRDAVERAVAVVPGDAVAGDAGQRLLRGDASIDRAEALLDVVVAQRGPVSVRVRDVASVGEGAAPRIGAATADGAGEVVYVMAQMLRGANARDVTRALRARLPAVRAVLPPDVHLDVVYDRATLVDATLRTLGFNLLEGGVLVVVVLLLSLGSLRAGLVVALAIPASMLIAAAVMRQAGVGGNLMSLGAIDFGLLVDGAVVMVEHAFHVRRHAPDAPLAPQLERAARDVARPVFAGVIVIVLVYVPVLALTGVEGKLYRPMAITVVLALLAALVFALTLVPALAAVGAAARLPARDPLVIRVLDRGYGWILPRVVRAWPVVAGLALAALVGAGLLFARTGAELTPQLDEGDLVVQTTRAPDMRADEAVAAATRMEAALRAVPEVRQVVSRIGSPAIATDTMGLDQADVFVALHPRARWRPG